MASPPRLSLAQQRIRKIRELNPSCLPQITYGKRSEPIPLKGDHFVRRDIYDLPTDEENDRTPPKRKRVFIRTPVKEWREVQHPHIDDLPLSEDELEAVYGQDASPILSPVEPFPSKRKADRRQREVSIRPSAPLNLAGQPSGRDFEIRPRSSPSSVSAGKPQGIRKTSHRSKIKQTERTRPRKARSSVPANELILVRDATQTPASSPKNLHAAESSPPLRAHNAEISSVDESSEPNGRTESSPSAPKASVTSIRKRLKTPRFTHKSIIALRKKQRAQSPFFKDNSNGRRLGDGFESFERKVAYPAPARRRKTQKAITLGFAALSLKSGPLPDVEFRTSSAELELNNSETQTPVTGPQQTTEYTADTTLSSLAMPAPRRAVTFSDLVLDEMSMQRLSSISAPKMVYSISSDDEEDEEPEEDWNESDLEPEDEDHQPSRQNTPQTMVSSNHVTHHGIGTSSDANYEPANNIGVTLDFRKSATPRGVPFNKQHLVEVDEMILDVPDKPNEFSGPERTRKQPRSILRTSTPSYQHSDTRPQHTAANTRRNSNVQESHFFGSRGNELEDSPSATKRPSDISCFDGDFPRPEDHSRRTVVDLNDNRYFSTATSMLHKPPRPQPRILKHRSSQLRRSYLSQQDEVLVADSDDRVAETDLVVPETSVYADSSSRPKDLRGLTRAVSKEFGTLSQSQSAMRRRPSQPFRSPVKLR